MIDTNRSELLWRLKCWLVSSIPDGKGSIVAFVDGPGNIPSVESADETCGRDRFAGLIIGIQELGIITVILRPAYIWTDDYEVSEYYSTGYPLYVSRNARFSTNATPGGQVARVVVAPCPENPFMLVGMD